MKSRPLIQCQSAVLALLSHVLNHATEKGERPDTPNPCRRVKRYAEHTRERFLSVDELAPALAPPSRRPKR